MKRLKKMKIIPFMLLALAIPATAQDEVGKVWLKSDPAGASIFLSVKDKDGVLVPKDTGKKTNALIELPAGKQTLVLHLEGYENATVEVSANPAAIAKPETVVLSKPSKPVDILFTEDGWIVFVDDKGGDAAESARDAHNQVATTPCTIKMTMGKHTIDLHKAGFLKISFLCEVTEKTTSIEVKGKIEKGQGATKQPEDKPSGIAPEKMSWQPLKDTVMHGKALGFFVFHDTAPTDEKETAILEFLNKNAAGSFEGHDLVPVRANAKGFFDGNPPQRARYIVFYILAQQDTQAEIASDTMGAGHFITMWCDGKDAATGTIQLKKGLHLLIVKLGTNGAGGVKISIKGQGLLLSQ